MKNFCILFFQMKILALFDLQLNGKWYPKINSVLQFWSKSNLLYRWKIFVLELRTLIFCKRIHQLTDRLSVTSFYYFIYYKKRYISSWVWWIWIILSFQSSFYKSGILPYKIDIITIILHSILFIHITLFIHRAPPLSPPQILRGRIYFYKSFFSYVDEKFLYFVFLNENSCIIRFPAKW